MNVPDIYYYAHFGTHHIDIDYKYHNNKYFQNHSFVFGIFHSSILKLNNW